VVKFLKLNNFSYYKARGSHFQYKKSEKNKVYLVVVQSHGNKSIPVGTMNSIVKQSGIKKEKWIKFSNKNKKLKK
jgi:predicted RNA binding protein YcfA (HicA-like mRNA interferase family)